MLLKIRAIFLAFLLSPCAVAGEKILDIEPEALESIGRMGENSRVDPDNFQFSEAEELLWRTEQLANIKHKGILRYSFIRSGSQGDGFEDSVELHIVNRQEDGTKTIKVNFFTGDRNRYIPPREKTNSNPLFGLFLQSDVYEMDRLTNGNWRYFQRWIKKAIAYDARIEGTTITFNNKEYQATTIHLKPFIKDPKRARYKTFADKVYEVTVSKDIPGMLYKIRTRVPAIKKTSPQPFIEESLTLVDTEFSG